MRDNKKLSILICYYVTHTVFNLLTSLMKGDSIGRNPYFLMLDDDTQAINWVALRVERSSGRRFPIV